MKKKTACFISTFPNSVVYGEKGNIGRKRLQIVVKEQVINMIITYKVSHFIGGIDLGISQYFAETVLELKNEYPHITMECVLHCEEQAIRWTEYQRNRYYSIVERCDNEMLLQSHHTDDCLIIRDKYMVRKSNFLLAVLNGKNDETTSAVHYARSISKHVIVIDPETYEVRPNIHII